MRRILLFIIGAFLLFIPAYAKAQTPPQQAYSKATIVKVTDEKAGNNPDVEKIQNIELKIDEGAHKGKTYKALNPIFKSTVSPTYKEGERVIVTFLKGSTPTRVQVIDHVRSRELLLLFFIFLAFIFAIGRLKGVTSFAGLIFSFLVIMKFIVPNIIAGSSPVVIALLGAFFIIPITFFVSHGLNRKTVIAAAGTALALFVTASLAFAFINAAHILGLASEEATFLQALKGRAFDITGLLLAGIIIGALGVLDDITISQASIVERLAEANPRYNPRELYTNAMKVGRDHIASLVNTLVLVYTGASLPLLLLFYDARLPYDIALNQELVATEIVRALVSSIGIVAAVPITTALAVYNAKR